MRVIRVPVFYVSVNNIQVLFYDRLTPITEDDNVESTSAATGEDRSESSQPQPPPDNCCASPSSVTMTLPVVTMPTATDAVRSSPARAPYCLSDVTVATSRLEDFDDEVLPMDLTVSASARRDIPALTPMHVKVRIPALLYTLI